MEMSISPNKAPASDASDVDQYRERLVKARVKTEEDLKKMSEEDVKKLYLKHEQTIVDGMADQVSKMFAKTWSNSISRVVPIDDEDELEKDLSEDIFLKAAIKNYFPSFYYDYGKYCAPASVLLTTGRHVNYKSIKINGNGNAEPEEGQAEESSAAGGIAQE